MRNLVIHERGHHGDLSTLFHTLGVRSFLVDFRYFTTRRADFVMDELTRPAEAHLAADLTIRNARIIDGTGAPPFSGDIEISDGRIQRVGEAGAGRERNRRAWSRARPRLHRHRTPMTMRAFIRYPGMEFKLAQGVTCEVSGNCGLSSIPNEPGRTSCRAIS